MTHRPPAARQNWTTRALLAWLGEAFTKRGLDSPRLMAELLVSHVLGTERLKLYLDVDRPASPLELQTLRDLVRRALNHEPIQYLTGQAWFFGMPFHVDRRVLVPRPSTETIVERVMQHARAAAPSHPDDGVLIGDICTGSGCIAIALLKHMPRARAVAVDVSAEALEAASGNAVHHGVADRLELLCGDLVAPLDEFPATRGVGALSYLVSNPPYIPDEEWDAVPRNVKDHEPTIALRAGEDGLGFVRRLLSEGVRYVKPGGLVLIEVATSRAVRALEMVRGTPGLADARVLSDFEGLARVVEARKS